VTSWVLNSFINHKAHEGFYKVTLRLFEAAPGQKEFFPKLPPWMILKSTIPDYPACQPDKFLPVERYPVTGLVKKTLFCQRLMKKEAMIFVQDFIRSKAKGWKINEEFPY
jgi:hypothetical protein